MEQVALLDELAIIATLGVLVTVVLSRFKLPTVAGLLLAGALLGPYGFKLVSSVHAIETLSEIGVVLLLFSIGLEFSLERLKDVFRQVAVGGTLQVGLTMVAAAGLAAALGQPLGRCLFYGFVFALSSTAIGLRALMDNRELDAPHGRFIVGTLIFQDLCVVPMVLIVPLLAANQSGIEITQLLGMALGKAALVVLAIVLLARFVVPKVLALVDASRSREVFLLAVLSLCIGTAWITSLAGLSLALGAFLGGMVVAGTEYGHRAMGDILPLRDAFVSVFFVSLGMLFDIHVVLAHPVLVFALMVGFLFGKSLIAGLAAMALRFPARVGLLAGVGLGQFGEFGFVLARLAEASGVVDHAALGPLMSAGIGSMFLSPVLMRLAPQARWLEKALSPLERLFGTPWVSDQEAEEGLHALRDHVIVVGYGVAGRLAVNALAGCNISYVILELNARNVEAGRDEKHPIYYGDATNIETLEHFKIDTARALVLLINDPQAAARVVDTVRRVAPKLPVLMRTRYLGEKQQLMGMGATDVVAEEVEAGVEVAARLMRWCDVPRNRIDERLQEARDATQTSERAQLVPRRALLEHESLADLKIESVEINSNSSAQGRSAVKLEVRQRTQALIVAVRRDGQLLDLDPQQHFQAGDVVYLVGSRDSVAQAVHLLSA